MNQFRNQSQGAAETSNSVHLSTSADSKFGNTPWLNIESAGWLNIQSALTGNLHSYRDPRIKFSYVEIQPEFGLGTIVFAKPVDITFAVT